MLWLAPAATSGFPDGDPVGWGRGDKQTMLGRTGWVVGLCLVPTGGSGASLACGVGVGEPGPSPLSCPLLPPQQVHLIVGQALKRYSEDRVGMVDYALESAGRWWWWGISPSLGQASHPGEGCHGAYLLLSPLLSPLCPRGQRHQHPLLGDLQDADGSAELVWHPPVVPVAVPPCHPAGGHPRGRTPLRGRTGVVLMWVLLGSCCHSKQAARLIPGGQSSTDGNNLAGVLLLCS